MNDADRRRRGTEHPERPSGDALVHLLDEASAGGERLAGQLADRLNVCAAHDVSLQQVAVVLHPYTPRRPEVQHFTVLLLETGTDRAQRLARRKFLAPERIDM